MLQGLRTYPAWPVKNLDLLKLNLEAVLTENYKAVAICCPAVLATRTLPKDLLCNLYS